MERLRGVDAGFLYMETPALHMHTLKIAVLDVTGVPDGYSFDRLRTELTRRLPLLPAFRRRVLPVPLRVHHPVWVEDADFDLDRHVHRLVLAPPGDWRQVEDAIGEIASTPLDRRHALWQLWVLEGGADGHVTVVAKVHHTLADGVAAAGLLANVMAPAGAAVDPPADEWRPDAVPGARQLLRDAVRDLLHDLGLLPGLLARTAGRGVALARQRRRAAVRTPRPILDCPRASFNRALTPRRTFATTTLSLTEVRGVAKANGVTVNDVLLAVTGTAVRRALAARGERLSRPLVASVPVSADGDVRLVGNKVSSLITSLCDDVTDPVRQLRRVHEVAVAAKGVQEVLGLDMLESWVQYTPPGLFSLLMRTYSRLHGANLHPPPINLVVSNVPGPREPLEVVGGRLHDLFSVGPILEGIGLNVTAWSYLDRFNVGLIACPDTLPDLRGVAAELVPAFAELRTASDVAAVA